MRDDTSIEELMGLAVEHRPDLKAARTLLAASKSDRSGVAWGALGPQLQAAYSYGALGTRVGGETSGLHERRKLTANAGFAFGVSSFGQMKTARANFRLAATAVEKQLDAVRVQVVSAQQSSITASHLLPTAREQVDAAGEALRLAQANLKPDTMLLLDVLQAQNEVDDARLRYAEAVVKYTQSQLNLLAALGLLDAERLAPPSTQPSP